MYSFYEFETIDMLGNKNEENIHGEHIVNSLSIVYFFKSERSELIKAQDYYENSNANSDKSII